MLAMQTRLKSQSHKKVKPLSALFYITYCETKSWTLFPNQSSTRWTLLSIEIFLLSLVDKCLTFMNFNTLKYTKLRRLSLHSDNLDKRYFVTVRNSLPYWITSLSSMLQFNKYFAHFVMSFQLLRIKHMQVSILVQLLYLTST